VEAEEAARTDRQRMLVEAEDAVQTNRWRQRMLVEAEDAAQAKDAAEMPIAAEGLPWTLAP